MEKIPKEHAKELQALVEELQKLSEFGIAVVAVTSFLEGEQVGNTIITNVGPAQAMDLLHEAIDNVNRPSVPWYSVEDKPN